MTTRTRIPHRVEALLFDYDSGCFAYQPITEVFHTHAEARLIAFLCRFDHPTARCVSVLK